MIVVSDTSPLNYLVRIGCVEILPQLFSRVLVPDSVIAELRHPRSFPEVFAWATQPPEWLQLTTPTRAADLPDLDRGERDAIGLALELGIRRILVDDGAARTAARDAGLLVQGTLGIIEQAARAGLVDLNTALKALRQTNYRATPELYQTILRRNSPR